MYSSLLTIDLVADADGITKLIQTDHRDTEEMAAEPEISVLFAIARILSAKAYGVRSGKPDAQVVYGCMNTPSKEVVEAIAACGGLLALEVGKDKPLAPVAVTPGELADAAFRNLAKRALAATGLSDYAAALHALEAEIAADPPDAEDDEITYWTRVLELSALTGEVLRAAHGGQWIEHTEQTELPFAFAITSDRLVLPTNRAARFIREGEDESMFLMLASAREHDLDLDKQPVLPSLRSRTDVEGMGCLFRPLLEKSQDPELPVIAYGHDTPTAFGLMKADQHTYSDELHRDAVANLASQDVTVEEVEIADVQLSVVSGGFFATEKILDPGFMRTLHRTHGDLLAVIVPARGLMMVTSATDDPQRTTTLLKLIAEKESASSRGISTAILLVQDGTVVGHAKLGDAAPPPEPPKKPGFFGRLFGRR